VTRTRNLTEGAVTGIAWAATVRLKCVTCGTRFQFVNGPAVDDEEPMAIATVSGDGTELRTRVQPGDGVN
jgi:hypothetical protein